MREMVWTLMMRKESRGVKGKGKGKRERVRGRGRGKGRG